MMPKIDGIEVCKRLKADALLPFMPIIMVTAKADTRDIVAGLDAGADEYLTKPVDQAALVAGSRPCCASRRCTTPCKSRQQQLAEWNQTLEQRVQEQVGELERMGRLKRFFSPQLSELVVSAGGEKILQSHRREVSVVFCDLRGFTAFTEAAEPEEVMEVLREYHTTLGRSFFASRAPWSALLATA